MNAPRQRTIAEPVEFEGIGLHSGGAVRGRLLPAEAGGGIRFRRTDLPGSPEVAALLDNVVATERGTTLADGEARVQAVEHLLAAISARQIDALTVELDAPEPPAMDGSAREFCRLLDRAGASELAQRASVLRVEDAVTLQVGSSRYSAVPADGLMVSAGIAFDHPSIGRQFGTFLVTPESFDAELSPARTFGFLREVEALRARGLALGGSVDNAVVLTDDGIVEGTELRFPDEFVRHKALDLVGDLALVGARLVGHFIAERPSHEGNVAFARKLAEQGRRGKAPVMSIQDILKFLPHRYPLLLVDRVVEFEPLQRIVGIKNVTINEPFFNGHFPGHPIMPGVLIVEAMGQVGGLLVMDAVEDPENKIVLFMSLDKVKWRRPVTPGDQIRFEVEVVQIRGSTCRLRGVGIVEGNVVAEAEMMARVVDR
jgi:UDP-3-O-[3-hydroxymyristoyl] N-acetylglucosamine deacetylase / 3-hydroxyacyl-[acyl-carrier-protein] dehydratase